MTSPFSRRDFFRISGLGGTLAALAACNPLRDSARRSPLDVQPSALPSAIPIQDEEGLILHTLRRATFGPTMAERELASQMGLEAWLEEQLSAGSADAVAVSDRLLDLETLHMSPAELRDLQENGRVASELVAGTVTRQIFSSSQLFEVMVDFWTNHFNIHAFSAPELFLKGADDREVIRAHALGNFPDLLAASAHSPAMLIYLDNARSREPSPNENYAREILELHTLGVDGGYTYADIQAVARAFTGWSISGFRRRSDQAGQFVYLPNWHDTGSKTVLGEELPGGKGDGDRVLEILAQHPSTARFVATELCQRFVADMPSDSIVEEVAATYAQTNGDIPAMLRTIFFSEAFAASAGLKLKRPLDFVVSVVRVTGADGRLDRILRPFLQALGQVPFGWPAPDGYPDYAEAWSNTNQSLYRWNLALVTASGLAPGISIDLPKRFGAYGSVPELIDELSDSLLGIEFPSDARKILVDFGESVQSASRPGNIELPSLLAGVVMCTPHFQIR